MAGLIHLLNVIGPRASFPPEATTHVPLFQTPPISEKNSDFVKIFQNLTFSRKISRFSSAEISDDLFFSHRPQISNFPPIFALSVHFPPVSRELLFPPYFGNFPPCFTQIHLLFTYFTFPPTLTMMHLCITQCTYWTPLGVVGKGPVCNFLYLTNNSLLPYTIPLYRLCKSRFLSIMQCI